MNIGGYEVLRRIGEGAYGKVYLARRGGAEGFRTYYALKRLHLERQGDTEFERYLLREARLGGLVNHPSLVRIHEVLRLDGEYVLVMDYVEGVTLRDVLGRRRGTGEGLHREVALEAAADILDALHYVHTLRDPEGRDSGFVHRDVKPGNIMLTPGGGLKLMDFGVARPDDAPSGTEIGELRGTIAYMSPEQAAGNEASPAADQFAAGLILLEMLTGDPAWGDTRASGILSRVVAGDVSHGLDRIADDDSLRPALERMLSKDTAARYDNASLAARALRGIRATLATPPALSDFVGEELAWFEANPSGTPNVPSWSSEPASQGAEVSGAPVATPPDFDPSGTWTGLDAVSDPAGVSLREAFDAPSPGPDPERTLPLGSKSSAVSAAALSAAEAAPVGPGPGVELGPGSSQPVAWSERTLPFTGAPMAVDPGATSSPSVPAPPLAPPSIPGGPLPAGGLSDTLPRRRARGVEVMSSPLLSSILGVLLVLLIFILAWLVFRTLPEKQVVETEAVHDADALSAADGERKPLAARPGLPPPAPAPTAAPGRVEEAELDELPENPEAPDVDPENPAASAARPTAEADSVAVAELTRPPVAPPVTVASRRVVDEAGPREVEPVRAAEPDTLPSTAELEPGQILGDDRGRGGRRNTAERRARDEQAEAAEAARQAEEKQKEGWRPPLPEGEQAAPVEASGPTLRFLSSGEQYSSVPLSLKVRPTGFFAEGVSVYYRWRSAGSASTRKRSLGKQGDGSYELNIPVSELRPDRLQVWFVAEPGGVALGSEGQPLEVRVR